MPVHPETESVVPAIERTRKRQKILAVSSGGGHWAELLRLRNAFEGHDVRYVTNDPNYRHDVAGHDFHVVKDANRQHLGALLVSTTQLVWLMARHRPDIVISTGAAPGYMAIRIGGLLGARTIWVDSVANAEQLSMSGEMAGKHVDLWLTQSEEVARPGGPRYAGAVL